MRNWLKLFRDVFTKREKRSFQSFGLYNQLPNKTGISTDAISVYRKAYVYYTGNSVFLMDKDAQFHFGLSWNGKYHRASVLTLKKQATFKITGSFRIYEDAVIYVNENATFTLGSGYINAGLRLSCFKSISIGKNVAIAENVTIRDSDNHTILPQTKDSTAGIIIGDHVWIGMNVTILKGVEIGEGSVIAAGAVVTKSIPAHSLAAGVPARVIKTIEGWK